MHTTLREYTTDDFPMVSGWWASHYGDGFRPGYVPGAAFIVEAEGIGLGFFGMCSMTPDFAYFSFPLVNPALEKEKRDLTIDFMIEAAKLWTKNAGHTICYISIRGEKFLNRLREQDFIAGEDGCQHMFAKVGEIK